MRHRAQSFNYRKCLKLAAIITLSAWLFLFIKVFHGEGIDTGVESLRVDSKYENDTHKSRFKKQIIQAHDEPVKKTVLLHELHNFSNPCTASIFPSRMDNAKKLFQVLTSKKVWSRFLQLIERNVPDSALSSEVVMVTAVSENHFSEMETLVASIYENYQRKYRLIVFDLGLEPASATKLKTNCGICEYRRLDFSKYSRHVQQLMTYAWKPLIVYELLHEFEAFIWCDASVRFKNKDLTPLVQQAKERGIATYDAAFNATCMTHPEMFAFLGEEACLYKNAYMIEANFIAWGSTRFSRRTLARAWAVCALDVQCIAPRSSRPVGCVMSGSPQYCQCHRFDQSALTVLLYRLMAPGPVPAPWIRPENNPWIHPVSMADIRRGDSPKRGYLIKKIIE